MADSNVKVVDRESIGLDSDGFENTTAIQAQTSTIKVLNVSGVPDTGEWFPMWLQVVEASVELINADLYPSISVDPVYNVPMLESSHFNEWLDSDKGHSVVSEIKIDKYLPEWVEKGRALVSADAGDDVTSDDELMAANYVHHEMLKLTGCVALFCWQW